MSPEKTSEMGTILESPQKSNKKDLSNSFSKPYQTNQAALDPPFFYTDAPNTSVRSSLQQLGQRPSTGPEGVRVRSVLERRKGDRGSILEDSGMYG